MSLDIFNGFYKGKTVLVTGHTGFKGSWLCIWLLEMGAKVIGLGLDPYTERDNFVQSGLSNRIIDLRGDICDASVVNNIVQQYKPEIIFHLAAQPLVRYSYEKPVETYQVNVMGSINVMEAMRQSDTVKVGVMITTDKCYENREQIWGYRENEAMGGYDPYSSSKGAAEIAISSWRRSFFNPAEFSKHGKAIASARAGNVIGGGDWAKDRIIPDCINALETGESIKIRSPKSIRPWQHVLEPLSGYLLLANKLWENPTEYAEGWNFGPTSDSVATVWDVATHVIKNYGTGKLIDSSSPFDLHEAKLLMLDVSKANYKLGWKPRLNIADCIRFTVEGYKEYNTQEETYASRCNQISAFLNY